MKKKKDVYTLSDIFREMELELVESFKRNMQRHKNEELKEGKSWEMWQKAALRNINDFKVRNRKLIKSYSKEVQETIDEVLNDTYESTINQELKLADGAGFNLPADEYSTDYGVTPPQEQDFFKVNDRKLDALLSEMDTSFSKTDGLIINRVDNVYKNTLDKVAIEMVSGTSTYQQAVDMATKDFLRRGLDVIQYKNGRRVNIATYAEMYLRTANQRAKFLAGGRVRDKLGVYTVLMSQHDNCSKMCLPFQGTVLIDDVYTSITNEDAKELQRKLKYPLLSYAMEEHAFHPNCRHNLTTWYPGKSSLPKAKHGKDKEKALELYKQEQHQRMLESNVRKWKRIEAGTLDPKEQLRAKDNVKKYQGELRDHIKDNPELRRDYWRERLETPKDTSEENVESTKTETSVELPYEDVTQKWLDAVDKTKKGSVTELDYFESDGFRYDSSNSTLRIGKNETEKAFSKLVVKTFKRDISEVPRIRPFANGGNFIPTPDYIFDSEPRELKSIEGSGKNTIVDAVNRGSNQARNFFVNILDKSTLTDEMIKTQISILFEYEKYAFVDKIVVFIIDRLFLIARKKR